MDGKSIIIAILVCLLLLFVASPIWKTITMEHDAVIQKIDEHSYQNRKDVEDTCRSMIAAYKADIDIYNLYKDSDNPNQKNYADAALVRAIQTAHTYNEYILKNSFVWENNVPADITMSLATDIK